MPATRRAWWRTSPFGLTLDSGILCVERSLDLRTVRRHRVCPAAAARAARHVDYRLKPLWRSLRRLVWPPIALSSPPQVERDAPVTDSVFSSASQRPLFSSLRLAWKTWRPLSFWLWPSLLPPQPVAVVLAWPVSWERLADAFRVAGFFSLNS